jgi:hypothetical protein
MSWFPDLGTITQVDRGEHVRAVGWLSAQQPFPVGAVPAELLGRLWEFAGKSQASIHALGWGMAMGWHDCELCDGYSGTRNFGVPHGELLFVAPEMLPHYVEVHRYHPPAEFMRALMESPLPGTDEYRTLAAPFQRLHQHYLERCERERLEHAARWVRDQGGSEQAIRQASLRFFGDSSTDTYELIHRALTKA